jgi:hypothetical protein
LLAVFETIMDDKFINNLTGLSFGDVEESIRITGEGISWIELRTSDIYLSKTGYSEAL